MRHNTQTEATSTLWSHEHTPYVITHNIRSTYNAFPRYSMVKSEHKLIYESINFAH